MDYSQVRGKLSLKHVNSSTVFCTDMESSHLFGNVIIGTRKLDKQSFCKTDYGKAAHDKV